MQVLNHKSYSKKEKMSNKCLKGKRFYPETKQCAKKGMKHVVFGRGTPKSYVKSKSSLNEAKKFFKETYPRRKMIVKKLKNVR